MNQKELFIKTLRDLESRLSSHDEYEILMMAGLLRKLLLDGDKSLVNIVNKEIKLKISFSINSRQSLPMAGLLFWSIEDGIDPEIDSPRKNIVDVNVDNLLKFTVMVINDKEVSVKEVISQMSNIEGAVHSAIPKSEKEKILSDLHNKLFLGGLPCGVRLLKAISAVVLRGLKPLEDSIVV